MPEPYAIGINQRTGKREYYWTKKDYQKGRATKSKSARQRQRRVYRNI